MSEKEKYTILWGRPEGYGNNYDIPKGKEVINFIVDELYLVGDESILDIGGGDGRLKKFFEGHAYTSLDIAPNAGADIVADITGWKNPGAYDIGMCCDVMEHIPPESVTNAINNIAQTCDRAAFMISTRPDRFGAKIGMTLHLTVRPPRWWSKELHRVWDDVRLVRDIPNDYCIFTCENL